MFKNLWLWINKRWPAEPLIRTFIKEEIPGGASAAFSFGACILFVFTLQAVTGIMQLFFFSPTTDHAYVSLSFLRLEVPFGWLVHNLHYWGATAMLVLVLVHMSQAYIWGAYKNPRQLVWLLGSLNFLLAMLMVFAGSPLPWDEKGYWATEVGTSIAGTVPLIGDLVKRILRGGEAMGQPTISRFFVLHTVLLPGLLAGSILVHIVAFRRFGSAGPWQEARRSRVGQFWPDQVFKDLIMAGLTFLVLLTLAVFIPPDFTGPADPLDTTYVPKSEWNFLFLYQALKYFPGKLEAVGTVGIPLVIILLLVAAPFVDRRKERNPFKRPVAMGAFLLVAVVIIGLSVMGSRSLPGVSRNAPASPEGSPETAAATPVSVGPELVKTLGCLGCHTIRGEGGKVGPDLSAEAAKGRTREWLVEQIRNPKAHNPSSVMPAFSNLDEGQADALVGYLLSLGLEGTPGAAQEESLSAPAAPESERILEKETDGEPREMASPAQQFIGNAKHGSLLFRQNCSSCHGPEGKGGVPNPGSDDGKVPSLNPIEEGLADRDPARFAAKIDPYIQNGETPSGPRPALRMPGFGKSLALTQAQISHLHAYILSLNGVERSEISVPGIRPARFYALIMAVFALGILSLIGIRYGKSRH
jgi:ubiquinol-cytochrome c reductase cytochrome b subunit